MRFALMISSFFALAAAAFANESVVSSSFESGILPKFAIEGQNFFISTECSPHSLNVNMQALPDTLVATGTVDYVRSDAYSLEYASQTITWRHSTFAGGFEPVSSTSTVNKLTDPAGFKQALQELTGLVDRIHRGNICFPSRPELGEVMDYLRGLANN